MTRIRYFVLLSLRGIRKKFQSIKRVRRPNVISHPVVHVTTPNAIVDTFIPLTTTTQLPTTTNRPYTVNAPRYSIHIPATLHFFLLPSPPPIMQPQKRNGFEEKKKKITDRHCFQMRVNYPNPCFDCAETLRLKRCLKDSSVNKKIRIRIKIREQYVSTRSLLLCARRATARESGGLDGSYARSNTL